MPPSMVTKTEAGRFAFTEKKAKRTIKKAMKQIVPVIRMKVQLKNLRIIPFPHMIVLGGFDENVTKLKQFFLHMNHKKLLDLKNSSKPKIIHLKERYDQKVQELQCGKQHFMLPITVLFFVIFVGLMVMGQYKFRSLMTKFEFVFDNYIRMFKDRSVLQISD